VAMDRRWVRIGHLDLRGDPGTGVIHLSISSVVVLPCTTPYQSIFPFSYPVYSLLHIGTPFFGQKSGVFNQLWEPQVDWWMGCEISLQLDPPVRRIDLVQFNYVDRSIVGPQPVTEGMGPVVSICNNGGVHRSPPLVPVVTIQRSSQARYRQGWVC